MANSKVDPRNGLLFELENGAKIISCIPLERPGSNRFLVLADNGHEYVTWQADGDGNCFWGEYPGKSYAAALGNFVKRLSRVEELDREIRS